MSDDKDQSLFITAYEGRDTADQAYDRLRELEKDDKIDIKTAATVWRKDNGKLKLSHKRRVTVAKGAVGGAGIALVLTGGGVLIGAGIGALIGSSRSGDRKDTKAFLEDKLGTDDSALVILVTDADWAAAGEAVAPFGGEELTVELTPDAAEQINELSEQEQVAAGVAADVEVEEVAEEA